MPKPETAAAPFPRKPGSAGARLGASVLSLGASILALAACLSPRPAWAGSAPPAKAERIPAPSAHPGKPSEVAGLAKATFAGGCFWCMESPYGKLKGVRAVVSGYTGGQDPDPTYEEVCRGNTGHAEAVEVAYDPKAVSYATLLEAYWREVDPTDRGGQFADRGSQYRPAIFYHNAEQKRLAEASRDALAKSGRFRKPIVVEIAPAKAFFAAEEYHQGYCRKNPARYQRYRKGSGREDFLAKTWGRDSEVKPVPATRDNDGVEDGPEAAGGAGADPARAGKTEGRMEEKKMEPASYRKPAEAELQKILTPMQYKVTQQCGTERAFTGEYWDNKREGIYVDVASGEPLFSSLDKFDSGTGWPSFTRALEKGNVVEKSDRTLGMSRTEIRSKHGDSHLGHVFDDGPAPTGLRYCVNSASLRFIPKEKLAEEGYGQYLALFNAR